MIEVLQPKVAPYVGAWIETSLATAGAVSNDVAPYVGAWIETMMKNLILLSVIVAPYVGAWIETVNADGLADVTGSHPTWVRGLKRGAQWRA